MKGLVLQCLVAAGLLAVWPLPSRALLMNPLSIEELTHEADVVVQGRVISKACQRDDAGRIYTRISLDISDVWKGEVQTNPITVVHGGGILGERKSFVSGQAHYDVGEEVVLFLARNDRNEMITIGLTQGKFHLDRSVTPEEPLVSNVFHGNAQPRRNGSRLQETRTQRLTLGELKRRVMASPN